MSYIVTLEATVTQTIDIAIEDGQDWDGRPVADRFDAADLAYDLALEREDDLDWQVIWTQEVDDAASRNS